MDVVGNRMTTIQVPSGPYPKCDQCGDGTLVPVVRVPTGKYEGEDFDVFLRGDIEMVWRCSKCQKVIPGYKV
jgi:hypothetical protein